MSNENEQMRRVFISYLDERNESRNGYVELIRLDQFLVRFKTTDGNIITIPLARVLKIKEKEDKKEDERDKRIISD